MKSIADRYALNWPRQSGSNLTNLQGWSPEVRVADDSGFARPSVELEIELLGARRPARLVTAPLFDPEGHRPRA